MKALVLGSEGQIGQYLVNELACYDTITYDLLLGEEYDLRRPNLLLYDFMTWADIVYFLAFDVGGSAYLAEHQGKYEYLDNNVKLMHNTFKALKRTNKPFIFASSQMSNMTNSSYGTLKNVGEFYTRSLGGINARFWNVYGQERDPDKFHVITDFISAAKTGEIKLRTDGTESRQFLWAGDAADALVRLGKAYKKLHPPVYYDITSFEWTTIMELAQLIARLSGGEVKVSPGKVKDTTQILKNEPTKWVLNYWNPTTSLDEGIKTLMEAEND